MARISRSGVSCNFTSLISCIVVIVVAMIVVVVSFGVQGSKTRLRSPRV